MLGVGLWAGPFALRKRQRSDQEHPAGFATHATKFITK
jgi:hypothetical protein